MFFKNINSNPPNLFNIKAQTMPAVEINQKRKGGFSLTFYYGAKDF